MGLVGSETKCLLKIAHSNSWKRWTKSIQHMSSRVYKSLTQQLVFWFVKHCSDGEFQFTKRFLIDLHHPPLEIAMKVKSYRISNWKGHHVDYILYNLTIVYCLILYIDLDSTQKYSVRYFQGEALAIIFPSDMFAMLLISASLICDWQHFEMWKYIFLQIFMQTIST